MKQTAHTIRVWLAAFAVGALGAAAVLLAPHARADDGETGFLETLTAFGMIIYDTQRALASGYQICDELTHTTGKDEAADILARTNNDVPNMTAAEEWVIASAMNLCPWEYHPNGVSRTPVAPSPVNSTAT